jgi:hypothetical protein
MKNNIYSLEEHRNKKRIKSFEYNFNNCEHSLNKIDIKKNEDGLHEIFLEYTIKPNVGIRQIELNFTLSSNDEIQFD